ncbi:MULTISPECIES: hypothetical protein [Xenorhabdus]|uniref:hypothetical protein n=1 Tax=Xenorhabdus TaxID=626 RepID=UPI000647B0E0|nr:MULTISPECIES: hypothetical protein [Xenorhabdus]
MSEKKSFWASLFGKQKMSTCCAVRIEEVSEESTKDSGVKPTSCCDTRIEPARESNLGSSNSEQKKDRTKKGE